MTSGSILPNRFTKIDHLTRSGHLTEDDTCYFIKEYTARAGYEHSESNQLIFNFKKEMDRRKSPDEWRYKQKAIDEVAKLFRECLLPSRQIDSMTFVPIPPSKLKGDPLYDDRLTKMLKAIRPEKPLDVRELIIQKQSMIPFHQQNQRIQPDQLAALYCINTELMSPTPSIISVVDDILTTGTHFRAAKSILSSHFPNSRVIGMFIARTV